jgi:uncharacterized protein
MKPGNLIIGLAAVAIIIILYYSLGSNTSQEEYVSQIIKERQEKDRFMKSSAESPFSGDPDRFTALKYYPPNEKFRVVAKLTPIKDKKSRLLGTSDGKDQHYLEYGYAEFDLDNRKNRLLILEVMEEGPDRGSLFLAFGDQTSAGETYGAGRYLDIKKLPGSATVELDFNKAYNPYCAYNHTYSCPLPPAENLLNIAIQAGEKNYE